MDHRIAQAVSTIEEQLNVIRKLSRESSDPIESVSAPSALLKATENVTASHSFAELISKPESGNRLKVTIQAVAVRPADAEPVDEGVKEFEEVHIYGGDITDICELIRFIAMVYQKVNEYGLDYNCTLDWEFPK